MKKVDKLMKQAVADRVFPGGVLLVSKENRILFFEAYGESDIYSKSLVTTETVFDLASLTKPLATVPAIIMLVQDNRLALTDKLGQILPDFANTDKADISIRNLLCHNSGLPDYQPYYKILRKHHADDRKQELQKLLVKEPSEYPKKERTVYSDIGFMILEWIVEAVSGHRLDSFTEREIYKPIGLNNLFFIDLNIQGASLPFDSRNIAATERCPWRKILLKAKVHDDNAFVSGGIGGHAGLFGTAVDVHNLLSEIISVFHGQGTTGVFQTEIIRLFLTKQKDSERALGFDTPCAENPSCGRYFSENTVGHLGFTGVSFWIDLDRSITVILLTNRVHPSRDNERIKTFRPVLHDAVMETLLH